jgi:hypothetical protein
MGWPIRVLLWWVAWQVLVYCTVRLVTGSTLLGVFCACFTAWTLNKDRENTPP